MRERYKCDANVIKIAESTSQNLEKTFKEDVHQKGAQRLFHV